VVVVVVAEVLPAITLRRKLKTSVKHEYCRAARIEADRKRAEEKRLADAAAAKEKADRLREEQKRIDVQRAADRQREKETQYQEALVTYQGTKQKFWHSYGNYCGPGWTSGKVNGKYEGKVKALDKVDAVCKDHDLAVGLAKGLKNECERNKAIRVTDQKALAGFTLLAKDSAIQGDEKAYAMAAQTAFTLKAAANNLSLLACVLPAQK